MTNDRANRDATPPRATNQNDEADWILWVKLVGPFLDGEGAASFTHRTIDELRAMSARHDVLMLETGNGEIVFPRHQFTDDGDPVPHLGEVLTALSHGTTDRWTWALWLSAPNEDHGDQPAWVWLANGGDPAPVISEAYRDAGRWAT